MSGSDLCASGGSPAVWCFGLASPGSQRGRNVLSPVPGSAHNPHPSSPHVSGCPDISGRMPPCQPCSPCPRRPARPCPPAPSQPSSPFVILAARPLGSAPKQIFDTTLPSTSQTSGSFVAGKSGLAPYRCSEPDPAVPSNPGCPWSPSLPLPARGSFSLIPQGSYAAPSSGPLFFPLPRPTRQSSHCLSRIVAPLTIFQIPDISASGPIVHQELVLSPAPAPPPDRHQCGPACCCLTSRLRSFSSSRSFFIFYFFTTGTRDLGCSLLVFTLLSPPPVCRHTRSSVQHEALSIHLQHIQPRLLSAIIISIIYTLDRPRDAQTLLLPVDRS